MNRSHHKLVSDNSINELTEEDLATIAEMELSMPFTYIPPEDAPTQNSDSNNLCLSNTPTNAPPLPTYGQQVLPDNFAYPNSAFSIHSTPGGTYQDFDVYNQHSLEDPPYENLDFDVQAQGQVSHQAFNLDFDIASNPMVNQAFSYRDHQFQALEAAGNIEQNFGAASSQCQPPSSNFPYPESHQIPPGTATPGYYAGNFTDHSFPLSQYSRVSKVLSLPDTLPWDEQTDSPVSDPGDIEFRFAASSGTSRASRRRAKTGGKMRSYDKSPNPSRITKDETHGRKFKPKSISSVTALAEVHPETQSDKQTSSRETAEKQEGTNTHGLSSQDIHNLHEFHKLFLIPREWDDPLLEASSTGKYKQKINTQQPLLSAHTRPQLAMITRLRNFESLILDLASGTLTRWRDLSNEDLDLYFGSANEIIKRISGLAEDPIDMLSMVDAVRKIIDSTCDPQIRSLLYPYLDSSSHKKKNQFSVYAEPKSLYYKIWRPHNGDEAESVKQTDQSGPMSEVAPGGGHITIEKLTILKRVLWKLTVKTNTTKLIQCRRSENGLLRTLDDIAKTDPASLDVNVDHAKSKLREANIHKF